ncbi:putative von Willebrand factor A domain-containing protein 5A [Hypsibius exemplaris]|uniref:von Willebrand factor A domain-containing protein 5A n=1 Tax=Hypsibius exemplaris TaxID=2072580 RepID=A0A1W0WDL3_HYPEX|nr:putative von Willebrand factor A domain-containing protein 5A [Hypsibius exemplaris]
MQIFLRSIPEGCYFNFYRFGSQFQSLFDQSQPYSAKSFNEAKDYARDTRANLGGTEILEPLKKIFSAPPQSGFSRQLFVLTDGDVTNTEEVIELVRRNAHNTRVFSFGLGNSPSRSLVNGIVIAGNGKSEFIKSGEVLEDKIGRHLQRALQPAVTRAMVTWSGVRNVRPEAVSALPPVFVGDRQLTFAIFEWDGATETASPAVVLQTGDSKVKSVLDVKSVKLTENPFFSKLAARALIKHLETAPTTASTVAGGSLQQRGVSIKPTELKTDGLAEEITKISLEYGVMSKYVSLVAVETRSEQERNTASGRMQLQEIPVQKVQFISPSVNHRMFKARSHRSCLRNARATLGLSTSAQREFLEPGSRGESVASSSQPPLNVLLDLQQWDGSWTFSPEVEAITKVSAAEAATAITKALGAGVQDVILATLLVVIYIKNAFPDKSNIWQAILNKADTFLAKRTNGLDVSSVSAALLALITSK